MSAPPQGLVSWPGLSKYWSAHFTLGHGVSPSVATIFVPPQPNRLQSEGTLTFTYGRERIQFPGCRVDRVDHEAGDRFTWIVSILDRRWQWRLHGRISGWYNRVKGPGFDRLKSPQQLARLCLEAMGERRFDVSQMPNGLVEEVVWEEELPADALAQIADRVGCRVVLGLDDVVRVLPVGRGKQLPAGADVIDDSLSLDPPEAPDKIVLVGDRTLYQHDFFLDPVGPDLDGKIKIISNLSYRPRTPHGFGDCPLSNFENVHDPFNRRRFRVRDEEYESVADLAKTFIWRLWRIATPVRLPGGPVINDLEQILPIDRHQVITRVNSDGVEEREPAVVWGKFVKDAHSYENASKHVTSNLFANPKAKWPHGFSIDAEEGLVYLSEPATQWVKPKKLPNPYGDAYREDEEKFRRPADLFLRTAVGARDAKTFGWERAQFVRKPKRPARNRRRKEITQYILQEDVQLQKWMSHGPRGQRMVTNMRDAEAKAKHYLDGIEQQYQLSTPRQITYAGLKRINLDGAIQQVSWTIGEDGVALTRASRNREEIIVAQSFKQRRFLEQLRQRLRADTARRDGKKAGA